MARDVSAIERIHRTYTKGHPRTEQPARRRRNVSAAADPGLLLVSSMTRGSGVRLNQLRTPTRTCAGHFACRAPSQWNKLLTSTCIVNSQYINNYKKILKLH
jgi:hypothetical protein